MESFYKSFIHPNYLCFDIGANIGERTSIFRELGAKVITVEPQKKCVEILTEKFRNDSLVTIIPKAVGSKVEEGELFICNEYDECSTLSQEFVKTYSEVSKLNWTVKEKVQITTLDELCNECGIPDFCKIDVEGFESEVFKGLTKSIPIICFEFNQHLIHDTLKSLERIQELGNYECNYLEYEKMNLKLDKWKEINPFCENLELIISKEVLTGEVVVRLK